MTAHRLFIDGIPKPIVAERLDRGEDEATLLHPLAFLKLGTGVSDEQGNTYKIRGVDLQLRDGVPMLMVSLDPQAKSERARKDSTPARKQSTIAFERPKIDTIREVVVGGGERHPQEQSPIHDRDSLLALLQPSSDPPPPSERPRAQQPAPRMAPGVILTVPDHAVHSYPATSSASVRLLASAPPAIHEQTTLEIKRPAYLQNRFEAFLNRFWHELKAAVAEVADELGIRRRPARLPPPR